MDREGGVSSLIVEASKKNQAISSSTRLEIFSRVWAENWPSFVEKRGSSSPRDEWRTDNTNLFFFSFSHNSRKRKKHFELIDLGLIPRGIEEGSRGSINRCHRACDEFIDRAFHSRTTLNPGQVAAGRSFSSNEPMLERSEKIILFPSLVRFYVESNLWNG